MSDHGFVEDLRLLAIALAKCLPCSSWLSIFRCLSVFGILVNGVVNGGYVGFWSFLVRQSLCDVMVGVGHFIDIAHNGDAFVLLSSALRVGMYRYPSDVVRSLALSSLSLTLRIQTTVRSKIHPNNHTGKIIESSAIRYNIPFTIFIHIPI